MENVIDNKIEPKVLSAWKIAFKHGDKTKIAIELKVARSEVQKCFDGDGTNKKVVAGINRYYAKQKEAA